MLRFRNLHFLFALRVEAQNRQDVGDGDDVDDDRRKPVDVLMAQALKLRRVKLNFDPRTLALDLQIQI